MTSFITKISRYSGINLLRKIIFWIYTKLDLPLGFYRKARFYFYTKNWLNNVGKDIIITSIGNNIKIGRDSAIYSRVIIEISEAAILTIGNNFTLSYGSLVACRQQISIGDNVMIGEYCSLRDTTHNHADKNLPFCKQGDSSTPISIGNNVWIGRGCIILPGAVIENNIIIAANSVVRGHLTGGFVYAGAPAKDLKAL